MGWGFEGGAWRWRHRLFGWEEESLAECCAVLENLLLQVNESGKWR
ncbi:YIPF1-like protein [Trifolium medium]|uniref:YIPF1-like protein n=1 Tax=Trifolium medium TaxID=97028 RepID=A0A392P0F0_9FABA|nr:YIPF1-like protein [Trifolium medium]